jgi:Na+-transporting methylmalonyl-CoA/oxaloacetate decarboxylase gamma subunit
MSPFAVAFGFLLVVALLALAWWIRAWLPNPREPETEAQRRFAAERFDTTMGELRDLREALRPVARAAVNQHRSDRSEL